MVFSSAFSAMLLFYRMERTSSMSFVFLAWNLFLAWIPFIVSFALRREEGVARWARVGAFVL